MFHHNNAAVADPSARPASKPIEGCPAITPATVPPSAPSAMNTPAWRDGPRDFVIRRVYRGKLGDDKLFVHRFAELAGTIDENDRPQMLGHDCAKPPLESALERKNHVFGVKRTN